MIAAQYKFLNPTVKPLALKGSNKLVNMHKTVCSRKKEDPNTLPLENSTMTRITTSIQEIRDSIDNKWKKGDNKSKRRKQRIKK